MAGISLLRGKYSMGRPNPDFHLLLFTTGGKGWLRCKGCKPSLDPGSLAIIPAGQPCAYGIDGPHWEILWLHVKPLPEWHSVIGRLSPNVRPSTHAGAILDAAEGMLRESVRSDLQARRAIRLYSEMIELQIERELSPGEPPRNARLRASFESLLSKVDSNLAADWTAASLARDLRISPGHLHRVSRELYGVPPMKLVTEYRMRRAEHLLLETDQTLGEIAPRIGYADAFAFSVAFKRYSGKSPRDYRRYVR